MFSHCLVGRLFLSSPFHREANGVTEYCTHAQAHTDGDKAEISTQKFEDKFNELSVMPH